MAQGRRREVETDKFVFMQASGLAPLLLESLSACHLLLDRFPGCVWLGRWAAPVLGEVGGALTPPTPPPHLPIAHGCLGEQEQSHPTPFHSLICLNFSHCAWCATEPWRWQRRQPALACRPYPPQLHMAAWATCEPSNAPHHSACQSNCHRYLPARVGCLLHQAGLHRRHSCQAAAWQECEWEDSEGLGERRKNQVGAKEWGWGGGRERRKGGRRGNGYVHCACQL